MLFPRPHYILYRNGQGQLMDHYSLQAEQSQQTNPNKQQKTCLRLLDGASQVHTLVNTKY